MKLPTITNKWQNFLVLSLLLSYTLASLCYAKESTKSSELSRLATVKNEIRLIKSQYQASIHGKEDLNNKEQVKNKLFFLAHIDQLVRTKLTDQLSTPDSMLKDNNPAAQAMRYMLQVDAFTLKNLKQILAKYQWITAEEFGPLAAQAAWLIIHHSTDEGLKYKALFILEHLVKQKKADPDSYALLYDVIATEFNNKFNIKQKYGTQFKTIAPQEIKIEPYDGTLKDLNARRLNLGLDSIESYIKRLEKTVNCKAHLQ